MNKVSLSCKQAMYSGESAAFSEKSKPEDIPEKQITSLSLENKKDEFKSIDKYSIASKPTLLPGGNVEVVTFNDVMENFEKEHGKHADTNWVARFYIEKANSEIVIKNNGGWIFVELPFKTAMKVLLPKHTHDGETKTLLENCGLTAEHAANQYEHWSEQDKENNPLCSGSLSYHLSNPNKKPIFLTVDPIQEEYDYGEIIDNPQLAERRLVHLDGLHRLVALAISNKQDQQENTISAYIACKDEPKEIDGLGLISRNGVQRS